MTGNTADPRTKTRPKTERPRLHNTKGP